MRVAMMQGQIDLQTLNKSCDTNYLIDFITNATQFQKTLANNSDAFYVYANSYFYSRNSPVYL